MRAALVAGLLTCASAHAGHQRKPREGPGRVEFGAGELEVTTIGGSGPDYLEAIKPCRDTPESHADGPAASSRFAAPTRTQMVDGLLHVLDPMNGCIRTIQDGVVASVTPCCTEDISVGIKGWGPQDMYVSEDQYLLLDSYNNVLKASPRPFKEWTVIAGNGSRPHHGQSTNGPALQEALNEPHGMAVTTDGSGDIYISETWSSCVKLLRNGTLTTIAGKCGFGGHADGEPLEARFQHPHHINLDPRDESILYLSDAECWDDEGPPDDTKYKPCAKTDGGVCFSGIRKIQLDRKSGLATSVSTVAGKATSSKSGKTSKSCNDVMDGAAAEAMFDFIHGTAFLPLSDDERQRKALGEDLGGSPEIYVCDEDGNRIRKIDLEKNVVSTVAGSGKEGPKDGSAAKAKFTYPGGIGLDTSGNIYVGDYESHRVRLVAKKSIELV